MTASQPSGLWSDDPATVDLLSFDAVAQTVADALLDDSLDPVALGLSGSWGSGKTTVLGLVAQELDRRGTPDPTALTDDELLLELAECLRGHRRPSSLAPHSQPSTAADDNDHDRLDADRP